MTDTCPRCQTAADLSDDDRSWQVPVCAPCRRVLETASADLDEFMAQRWQWVRIPADIRKTLRHVAERAGTGQLSSATWAALAAWADQPAAAPPRCPVRRSTRRRAPACGVRRAGRGWTA